MVRCVQTEYMTKSWLVTSLYVVIVISSCPLSTQPNESDEMEGSSLVVRRFGHLRNECSAVCTCGATS